MRTVEFIPLETSNARTSYAPKFQEGERARKTLNLVRRLSRDLGTELASAVSAEGLPTLKLELPPRPEVR